MRVFLLSIFLLAIFGLTTLGLVAFPKLIRLTERDLIAVTAYGANQSQLTADILGETRQLKLQITDQKIPAPVFQSQSVLAMDVETGQILFEENIHERLAPASTTKIMTGIIATNYFRPADVLTVYPIDNVGGSNMGLKIGEKLSFRSLLYGMLLNSGNDAAFTIASNFPGGLPAFVAAMNSKVSEMKLADTHFDNPAGFDSDNHFSSAYDLAIIAKLAVENPQLAKVVATKETFVSAWDKSYLHSLKNLNELLSADGVLGIKTGSTEKAGENFVGLVERSEHKVITVVLNSRDRFGETKRLMDWVYANYKWEKIYQ